MAKDVRAHINDLAQQLDETGKTAQHLIGIMHNKETGETRAAYVTNYYCRLQVIPGTSFDDKPFDGAEQCNGSFSLDQLERYITAWLTRGKDLTAAQLNNLGYAYACKKKPARDCAKRAFDEALERAESDPQIDPAIIRCIKANRDVMKDSKLPEWKLPEWPLGLRLSRMFLRQVRAGKVAGVRMMSQHEIEILKQQ